MYEGKGRRKRVRKSERDKGGREIVSKIEREKKERKGVDSANNRAEVICYDSFHTV